MRPGFIRGPRNLGQPHQAAGEIDVPASNSESLVGSVTVRLTYVLRWTATAATDTQSVIIVSQTTWQLGLPFSIFMHNKSIVCTTGKCQQSIDTFPSPNAIHGHIGIAYINCLW